MAAAVIALILVLRFPRRAVSFVQTAGAVTQAGTKLDSLGARTSVVLIKGYGEVKGVSNRYGAVNLEPVEMMDSATRERALGVLIHVKPSEVVSVNQDASIDYDELEGLIAAIDRMSAANHTATSFDRFEARYTTRGLLRLVVFDDFRGTNQAMLSVGTIPTAYLSLTMTELAAVRNELAEAKQKIEAIRQSL